MMVNFSVVLFKMRVQIKTYIATVYCHYYYCCHCIPEAFYSIIAFLKRCQQHEYNNTHHSNPVVKIQSLTALSNEVEI